MTFLQSIKAFFKEHVRKHLTAKLAIILVSVLCVFSVLFQYFRRDDSVPFGKIIGAVVVPFQTGINHVGSFLFQANEDRITLENASSKIEELEEKNIELEKKIEDLESLRVENEELRRLLSAKERLGDYESVEAQIIGRDGVNAFSRFTINKGSVDGIQLNMNVVNEDGLIGLVTRVGLNYAIVTSVIEDGTNVSVMTKNTHENCIVTGELSLSEENAMKLENASASIDFSKDGTLVTSYISDKYLPNLLVGYAEDVIVNEDQLTASGKVKTAVDFMNLNEVLVITTMREELKDKEE